MTAIYRDMDQARLDDAYNNRKAEPDFDALMAGFRRRGEQVCAAHPGRRDLRYGDRPRQRYDWIACGRDGAPTFMFIHGGYWQACEKEDFAFAAAGPLARGFDVVLAEYTLAPEATMTEIAAEIGRLLDHLAADRDGLGTAGRPLCLAGHSAGGHLTALYRNHPLVTASLAMSGLYDLEPISLSYLGAKLHLTVDEIETLSPLRHLGEASPAVVSFGASELSELVRQSEDYAAACRRAGQRIVALALPGCRHFDLCLDLAEPDGLQMTELAGLGLF